MRMIRTNSMLSIGGVAVLCALLAGCAESPAAPRVELGGRVAVEAALSEHAGHAVLLNIWATWCEPCVEELPDLLAVGDQFRDEGGVVLSVSYDLMVPDVERATIAARVERFLAARKLALPTVIYDALDTAALDERFALPGPIPVTLAFDRSGALVDREDGPCDRARFEALMRRALAR